MYAKVIVDVPARQTNRPFDYAVPPRLQPLVEVGSRVAVPFGSRAVQGFVVELAPDSGMDASKVKPLESVLDATPPLTPELVKLAHWISRTYICHEITALQAMIPGALKARYERFITPGPAALDSDTLMLSEEEELIRFVRDKEGVTLDALLARYPQQAGLIKELLRTGRLQESQTVKDRMAAKTALTVIPPEDPSVLIAAASELPASARRQKDVLQFLAESPEQIRLSELLNRLGISAGTVKSLAEKGLLELKEVEVFRDPYANRRFIRTEPLVLTPKQREVFEPIRQTVAAGEHKTFLLQGVTGSGKTEIYLQAIQQCLDLNKQAIVLVPEISLTPQMVERFKGRFGDLVAVLHSRLSAGERFDEWRKITLGRVKVVIGARSAIFAPFTRIGLIIIDEEHESSYKQEESPKYHARDVAIERARQHGAAVILGSATPSLESYSAAVGDESSFILLTLAERVEGRPMPPVRIVDMREELKDGNRSMFSRDLHRALTERLERGEQSVLLLNRRGYSTFVMCRSCGYTLGCPHCDISLTYHQSSKTVRCHYCGYAEPEPKVCPNCNSEHIRYFGTGTQRVEEELGKLFPGIRVIRMDVDTTTEKGSHEKWLSLFRNRQADVLLGTQMVAKGLDFPHVTLVGVIAADTVLHLPDFRASERTFQLLTQVAGRAGRHHLPGEVVVQTYSPEHYSIVAAGRHDFGEFLETELDMRRLGGYPPYVRLILITLSHEQVPLLVRSAESMAQRLKELASDAGLVKPFLTVLGPVASPIPRIKDRYRFQCVIKYRGDAPVPELVGRAVRTFDDLCRQENLQISVDVDPQVLL